MTMPHLQNCPHSPDGWCLECVGKLNAELDFLLSNFQAHSLKMNGLYSWRFKSGWPWSSAVGRIPLEALHSAMKAVENENL